MNAIEDRLRAATRAAADTVAPDSAPPLRLPHQPVRHGRQDRKNWARTMTPLAAAAAVIAVVATSLAITGGTNASRPGASGRHRGARAASAQPTTRHRVTTQGLTPAARAALASVPPYYVALTPGEMGVDNHAMVLATATGAVLATVTAPRPYDTFSFVTAAAGDRSFVLAAQQWFPVAPGSAGASAEQRDDTTPTKFYLLRLGPTGRLAALTALPIPQEPGSVWVDGIALSPDGSQLAVADDRYSPEVHPTIQLFNMVTGAEKEWVWPGTGVIGNNKPIGSPLSWAVDGRTLAFHIVPQNGSTEVRLLDTAAPGGSLQSSKLAVEWVHGGVTGARGVVIKGADDAAANSLMGYNTLITPDGSKIVCVTDGLNGPLGITEFSANTARIVRYLDPSALDILWVNASGSTVIVAGQTRAGVLSGDQVTPIPGTTENGVMAAW